MTATRTPAAMTVDAIRRRQRDPDPDPVQVRLDRDHLMGVVDRQREDIKALQAALLEQGQIAEEAGLVLHGVYETARKIAKDRSLNGRP